MKKTNIYWLLACLLAMVASCNSDDIINNSQIPNNKDKVFTVTATLGEDNDVTQSVESRLALAEEANKVSVSWEVNDEIDLLIVQGDVKKSQKVKVTEVTNEGKTAKFSFSVPEEIDSSKAFDLYGVHGGIGLDKDTEFANLAKNLSASTSLKDIQDNKNIILYFQQKGVSLNNLSVNFKHIGSLFRIKIKNNSSEALEGIKSIGLRGVNNVNKNWVVNNAGGDAKFDLINGKITSSTSSSGNNVTFTASNPVIGAGEIATFWAWYPCNVTETGWPEFIMDIIDTNGNYSHTTKYSKAPTNPKPGKAFSLYGLWDGETLKFVNNDFTASKKIPYGIREGSEKLLFAKKLSELGIPDYATGNGQADGLALSGGYLAINSYNENMVYIDPMAGNKVGEIDIVAKLGGRGKNYYLTSDGAGNILTANFTSKGGGKFEMYKMSSVTADPELFLSWEVDPVAQLAYSKFSVTGNVNSNAIISVPYTHNPTTSYTKKFVVWQVVDGVVSATPELREVKHKVSGHGKNPYTDNVEGRGWQDNVDIQFVSSTLQSDYFITAYGDNTVSWIDGNTDNEKAVINIGNTMNASNALDIIEFNNARYVAVNLATSRAGELNSDMAFILDATNDSKFGSGSLAGVSSPAIVWNSEKGMYGPNAIEGASRNNDYSSDVIFNVSEDGLYLYLYFIFKNGYVVGYQFDCIQQ
jgi:hypothetical protein